MKAGFNGVGNTQQETLVDIEQIQRVILAIVGQLESIEEFIQITIIADLVTMAISGGVALFKFVNNGNQRRCSIIQIRQIRS